MTLTQTRQPHDTAPSTTPATHSLAGWGTMVRLVVRRNRVRLGVWVLVLVGMYAYVVSYYRDILSTQEALDDFAVISNTPGIKALTGLASAANTLGGAVWTKIWMTTALALAFGVIFLTTRNGRADEEVGRTELLRSRMLGVHAYSVASWLVNAILCVVVGLGVAIVSLTGGLDPQGAGITGSLIVGASVTGVGLFGLGVGAVVGQVSSTSRGANGLGSTVIGLFFLLRMVGDLGDGRLTWASPIGWGQEMQPWGANRWWPFGLLLLLAAALVALAVTIESRRDLGAGLVAERRGPGDAPARYADPLGLALRLQRGAIAGWAITIVLAALMFGSVVEAMSDLFTDAENAVSSIARGVGMDALVSLLASMLALLITVFAIQSACALRTDEASGIIEPQLAGAVSRRRWVLQRLVIPAVGSAVLLGVAGALMGFEYGRQIGDPGQTGRIALATLAYWPAVMVFVGIAVALFGWAPRLAVALSWGALAASFFIVIVGDAMPDWLLEVLPFSATPYQPYEPMSWTPLIALSLAAIALLWTGIDRFSRRDISPG